MNENTSAGLEALVAAAGASGATRPVETWNPPYCGDIGIAIKEDGTWMFKGSAIGRPALVKLFASILRKDEDGRTYLVTPVEKVDCEVADAPFLAVEMAVTGEGRGQALTFRTNVDDVVAAGPDHPMRFAIQKVTGGLKPYVHVRGRLEALLTRALYADLVELAVEHEGRDGIWSGGLFWPFDGVAKGA
ncbi:MAG TPA: DUF1285 domain-containing protein [Hyphomicrobium sp.]|nr:DUF1285 domain-containing protein [Hyphomicrobium sp.]